jgi:hypothetical protein
MPPVSQCQDRRGTCISLAACLSSTLSRLLVACYLLRNGSPYDYDNRADDEYDAQELEARRIIDTSDTTPTPPRAMARTATTYVMRGVP